MLYELKSMHVYMCIIYLYAVSDEGLREWVGVSCVLLDKELSADEWKAKQESVPKARAKYASAHSGLFHLAGFKEADWELIDACLQKVADKPQQEQDFDFSYKNGMSFSFHDLSMLVSITTFI